MNYLIKVFILIFFLLTAEFNAQQIYSFKHLNPENGLSDNQVMCIIQDSKGYIWVGTQEGLNRYDGYNFKIFRHQPGIENSLCDYAVNAICEDSGGNLWIGTREGINIYNPKSETFKHLGHSPDDSTGLSGKSVWDFHNDTRGNMWIATRNGLNRFDVLTGKITRYLHDSLDIRSVSSNYITEITEDIYGNIWVSTLDGLNKYDYTSNNFTRYSAKINESNTLTSNVIFSISAEEDGTIWACTNKGLNKITVKEDSVNFNHIGIFNPDGSEISTIRSVVPDGDELWIATPKGLIRFYKKTGKYILFRHHEYDYESLSSNYIISLFKDASGVLWIGTIDRGINKLSISNERFFTYKKRFNSGNSISGNDIISIFESADGTLWIGMKRNGVNLIFNQGTTREKITKLELDKTFGTADITCINQDRNNNIWVSTFGHGIYILTPEKKLIRKITTASGLTSNFIHTVFHDKDGYSWIGTGTGGLIKYDYKAESFKYYNHLPGVINSLSTNEVISIAEDNKGNLWLGTTTGGLSRFNKSEEVFTHYVHNSQPGSINSNRILSLFIDSKNNLWVGTFGGGLNLFDPESETFMHLDTLPGEKIYSILEDAKGNLWISTNKGIVKYDTGTRAVKVFDKNDGLQGNDYNNNSSFISQNTGNIYFGGAGGFSFFNPDNISESQYIPDIVITDIKLFNESIRYYGSERGADILNAGGSYADQVNLSYGDNVFTIEFASLDYNNPEKNQYLYILEGFDKDWVAAGNKNFATYTNLDPGSYLFKVKGSNSDGIWNENSAVIKIYVAPPIWQRWWAYIIYFLFAVSIFMYIRKYELNRVELKNEIERTNFESQKLQEVDRMKSRFFANISHEFRTPLTLILGLLSKRMKITHDRSELEDFNIMRRNASRLLQLINQLLEISKIEAGEEKLTVSKSDIVRFVKRTVASFTSFASQKNIKLFFNGTLLSDAASWQEIELYFDQEKVETIIYNLLSNAVKFTPPNENIFIDIKQTGRHAEIIILNTGIGIPNNKLSLVFQRFYQVEDSSTREYEGTGIGLALVKDLVEIHKGEITVESKANEFVRFTLKFLLGRKHFADEQIIQVYPEYPVEIYNNQRTPAGIPEEVKSKKIETTIILIVEDNSDLRQFINDQLIGDYSIIEADNGIKGNELALEIIPDLVISDIMMPGMDGYTLCRNIKNNDKTSHIPVILLTARAASGDKLFGLETGADDYLVKPFSPDELKIRIRNLIDNRIRMRDKFRTEMILKPSEVSVPSNQQVFLEKLKSIIEVNLEDDTFGVDTLCKKIGMSRAQLHRKIKALSNKSTTELIREFRLQRAAELIRQDAGNMAEIAYKVGFSSQAYFTKSFQEFFNCSPTAYKKRSELQQ